MSMHDALKPDKEEFDVFRSQVCSCLVSVCLSVPVCVVRVPGSLSRKHARDGAVRSKDAVVLVPLPGRGRVGRRMLVV